MEKHQKISNHSWSPTFVTILVTNVGLQEFNKCCNLYAAVSLTWPKFFFFMCTKEKRQKWHICQEHQTKVHVIFWLFQKWAFCFDACTWDHGCNNKHLHCTEICLGACTCGLGCKYKPFSHGHECVWMHAPTPLLQAWDGPTKIYASGKAKAMVWGGVEHGPDSSGKPFQSRVLLSVKTRWICSYDTWRVSWEKTLKIKASVLKWAIHYVFQSARSSCRQKLC